MSTQTVAGHKFANTPSGECCTDCGVKWMDLIDMQDLWQIGKSDSAKVTCRINSPGSLSVSEHAELIAKRDKAFAML